MVYSRKLKQEIFDKWIEGTTIEALGREYADRPTKQTIWKWYGMEDWEGKKLRIHAKTDERLTETAAQRAVRHIKMLRAIQNKGIMQLADRNSKVAPRDVGDAIVKERLVCGDSTERIENTGLTVEELRDGCKNYKRTRKAARNDKKPNSSRKHTIPSK